MKLSKRIIKAINESIYKTLADIDDEDIVLTKSNIDLSRAELKYKDLKFVDDNFIDLDLISGNLWCTSNIGATCLDNKESWVGNYYAWGEITPKEEYDINTYAYKNSNKYDGYKKDNVIIGNTIADIENLLSEDDAASAFYKLNKNICMPTNEDFEELLNSTKVIYTESYNNISGLKGLICSSLKNENKHIFIPFCGIMTLNCVGLKNMGYYWTSTNSAYVKLAYYAFLTKNKLEVQKIFRYPGMQIRAILKTNN